MGVCTTFDSYFRKFICLTEETCQTVDGGIGSCLSIISCEPYVQLLNDARNGNNPALVQILRKAHCGFEGNNPKVNIFWK